MRNKLVNRLVASSLLFLVGVGFLGNTTNLSAESVLKDEFSNLNIREFVPKPIEPKVFIDENEVNGYVTKNEYEAFKNTYIEVEGLNLSEKEMNDKYQASLDTLNNRRGSNKFYVDAKEIGYCISRYGFFTCKKVADCANESRNQTKIHYGNAFMIDNASDAFRHGLLNAFMARDIGYWRAKDIADYHEVVTGDRGLSKEMDLHNNEIGRHIYMLQMGHPPNDKLVRDLLWWTATGRLVMIENGKLVKTR